MRCDKLQGSKAFWPFTYPARVYYKPRAWLLVPKRFHRHPGLQILLKVLARYRATRHLFLSGSEYDTSERIAEIPFVISNLGPEDCTILDVGSCWSTLPLELAHIGRKVFAVDQLPYALKHPNLVAIQADIGKLCLPSNFFDTVTCVSTIEHIGIGHYGDPSGKDGDKAAIKELRRVLKPGGKLLLTTPFGKAADDWQRVYDLPRIQALLSGFEVVSMKVLSKKGHSWVEVAPEEAAAIDSARVTHAVVMTVARKPA